MWGRRSALPSPFTHFAIVALLRSPRAKVVSELDAVAGSPLATAPFPGVQPTSPPPPPPLAPGRLRGLGSRYRRQRRGTGALGASASRVSGRHGGGRRSPMQRVNTHMDRTVVMSDLEPSVGRPQQPHLVLPGHRLDHRRLPGRRHAGGQHGIPPGKRQPGDGAPGGRWPCTAVDDAGLLGAVIVGPLAALLARPPAGAVVALVSCSSSVPASSLSAFRSWRAPMGIGIAILIFVVLGNAVPVVPIPGSCYQSSGGSSGDKIPMAPAPWAGSRDVAASSGAPE